MSIKSFGVNKLNVTGIATFSDTTNSTSENNGAVVIAGGVGISKAVNLKSDATINGILYVQGTGSQIFIDSGSHIDCNGDLDVDGHTNLDNVSIAGITTVNDGFIFDNGTNAGKDLQWQPSNNRLAFFNDVKATFGNTVDLQIYHNSTENHIYGSTSKPIIFSTNTNERLRITSGGQIGIGTVPVSGDQQNLTIHGDNNYEPGIRFKQAGVSKYRIMVEGGTGHIYHDIFADGGDFILRTNSATAADEKLRITEEGNVGIGTIPASGTSLDIDAAGGGVLALRRSATNASNKITLSHDGTDGTLESTNGVIFRAGGQQALRINSDQDIILKRASVGAIFRSDTTGGVFIAGGNDTDVGGNINLFGSTHASLANHIRFRNGGTVALEIDENGTADFSSNVNVDGFIKLLNSGEAMALKVNSEGGLDVTKNGFSDTVVSISDDTTSIISVTGKVGIGTDNPQTILHLHDSTNTRIQITDNGTGSASGDGVIAGLNGEDDFFINNRESGKGIKFFTGTNDERMVINSAGDVGIGTDPVRRLSLFDTAACVLELNSTSSHGTSLRIQHNHADQMLLGLAGDFIVGQTNNVTDSAIRANGELIIATGGGNEKLRITSGGNVGIGLTNPTTKLQVASGHINLSAGFSIQWGDSHERIEQSNGKLEFFTNNGEKMTLSGDNLGIGTDAPDTQLHLSGATPAIRLTDTDTAGPLHCDIESASGDLFLDTGSIHRDVIITSVGKANEIARFTGDGKVGIGTNLTTTPSSTLTVSPHNSTSGRNISIYTSGVVGNKAGIFFNSTSGTGNLAEIQAEYKGTNEGELVFSTSMSKRITIQKGGNVGIGSEIPTEKLDVAGNISVSGTVDGVDVATMSGRLAALVNGNTGILLNGVTATTQSASDNSTKVATTAFVTTSSNTRMPLAGGAFTGDITTRNMTPPNGVTNIDIGSSTLRYRNIFATTLDVTGNVSIGGTLTYEDVTNVDSIGIITARDQIKLVTDNKSITFGADSDLSVLHSGSTGVINNITGDLHIKTTGSGDDIVLISNDDIELQPQSGESGIKVIGGGKVELYNNGNLRFETRTDGVKITGGTNISMDSSGTGQLFMTGNGYTGGIALDADAMHIYHNSSSRSLILGVNETEVVRVDGNQLTITSTTANTTTVDKDILKIVAKSSGTTGVGFGGGIQFQSQRVTGNALQNAGEIYAEAEINSGTNISSALVFRTSTNGVPSEKLRITNDGHFVFNNQVGKIRANTSDGSDDSVFVIGGGGETADTRGAAIALYGNEFGSSVNGRLELNAGNVSNGHIIFQTGGDERLRITSGGFVNIGANNLTQTTYKFQVETGTNKFISFDSGGHSDFSNEGASILFSRPSDGSKELSGLMSITNGGLLLGARGEIVFATGGGSTFQNTDERARIDTSGNFGIGTNAPGSKLHVAGQGDESITLKLEQGTTSGNFSELVLGRTDGSGNVRTTPVAKGGIPISGIAGIQLGSESSHLPAVSIRSGNSSNGHIVFSPKGSEKVRIKSDGKVGIGVDPLAQLHVKGGEIFFGDSNSGSSSIAKLNYGGSSGNLNIVAFSDSGNTNIQFHTCNSGTSGIKAVIKNDGDFGIGTVSPGTKFHVSDTNSTSYSGSSTSSSVTGYFQNSGNNTGILLQNASTNSTSTCQATIHSVAESTDKNTSLTFGTRQESDGTVRERVRIKSDGNFGIGDNDPTYKTVIKVSTTTAYSASSTGDSQHQLRIVNTGLGGVAGLLFTAEPSSGSAGHAGIRVISPSSGLSDLIFSVRDGGTFSEKLRITNTGAIAIEGASNYGSSGQVLTSNGNGAPTWQSPSASSNASTVTVADESSDTTCFPLFVTAATGDLAPKSGSNLTFNSSSGTLAGTIVDFNHADLLSLESITGTFTGNVSIQGNTTLGNATSDAVTINAVPTIFNNTGLRIRSTTNADGAKINFSDHQSGGYSQNGTISYKHADGSVIPNSNDGWIFEGSETLTAVYVKGRLAIDEKMAIGHTTPTSDLHIKTASSPTIRLEDTTNTCVLLAYAQNSNARVGTYSDHDFKLDAGSTEAIHIRADNQKVIIGDTNSDAQFGVFRSSHNIAEFCNNNADAAGAEVALRKDSSSPADNDTLGILKFQGDNDAGQKTSYAYVLTKSTDVTDGTEDGDLEFHTRGNGTIAERLRIHSHGQLELKVPDANDALKITPSGTNANAKVNFNTPGTGSAVIKVQGTERLSIGADGRITNTGPDTSLITTLYASNYAKLDIRGTNIANSNHYLISYGEGHANDHQFHIVNTVGDTVFRTGASSTERLRINSSGEVLIGTSTNRLGEELHVLGSGIVASSAENTNMMLFGTFGSTDAIIGSYNSIPLLFRTGNTERLRIDTTGRIVIGGSSGGTYHSDGDNLNIYSTGNTGLTVFSGTSSLGSLFFADDNNDVHGQRRGAVQYNHSDNSLAFWTNASPRLTINSDGVITSQVNIGNVSARPTGNTTNVQNEAVIIAPSESGGSAYHDNHTITFGQLNGNWSDGTSGHDTAFGMLFSYANGTSADKKLRGGIVYDHKSTEELQIWSSYGSIAFYVDTANSGNETPVTCDTKCAEFDGNGHFVPGSDSSRDLGTNSIRWRNVYADTLYGNGSNLTNVNAATVAVSDESSDTSCNVLFAPGASGNKAVKSGSNLTFNSSTGLLVASGYSGDGSALTGLNASQLTSGNIPAARIASDAITQNKIADDAVGAAQLVNGSVGTTQLANNGVTFAKLENVAQNTILGRTSSGTGDAQELSSSEVRSLLDVTRDSDNKTFSGTFSLIKGVNDQTFTNKSAPGGTHGLFTNNSHSATGGFSALTVSANDVNGTNQAGSFLAQSVAGGHCPNVFITQRTGNNAQTIALKVDTSHNIEIPNGSLLIGGTMSNNAYNSVASTKLLFGGGNDPSNYFIGTNMENYGGNYTKLDLRWHTGIRMGAQPSYGGTRIFNNEDLTTLLLSIGKGDGHTRIESGELYHNSSGTSDVYWHETNFTGSNQSLNQLDITGDHGIDNEGWYRNDDSGQGLYNTANNAHFYSMGTSYWHINGSNSTSGALIFYSAYNGSQGGSTNRKGYVYWDSAGFGLLSNDGTWAYRHDNTTAAIYGTIKRDNSHLVWDAGNDGSGSGLDADKLDGVQGSSFLRSDANDSYTSGTLTITSSDDYALTFNNSANAKIDLRGSDDPYIRFREGSTERAYIQWSAGDNSLKLVNQESGNDYLKIGSGSNGLKWQYDYTGEHTVWHAANDGSGSGLDADKLDGVQGSSFLRSDESDSASANITINGAKLGAWSGGSSYKGIYHQDQSAGEYMIMSSDSHTFISATGGYHVYIRNGGNDSANELIVSNGATALTWRGNTVWTAENDGAGSGLDADKVDGQHASEFYRQTASASATVGPGWMTVATNTSALRHGEIFVSDSDSSDHAFIRIDWMRSYQDSNFTVINCGGHNNRITGVRVLSQDSDNTYGIKYLQVYVTVSSLYRVAIKSIQNQTNWTGHTVVTPVIQNSISGYSLHGNALEDLNSYGFAHEEGIRVGGNLKVNNNADVVGELTVAETIGHTGDTHTKLSFPANDQIAFTTGGTQRLKIHDNEVSLFSSNLLIDADGYRLKLGDSQDLQLWHGSSQNYIQSFVGNINYISPTGSGHSFQINSVEKLAIDSNGKSTFKGQVVIDHNDTVMLEIKPTNGSPWAIGINRDDISQSRVFTASTNGVGWVFEHVPKIYDSGGYRNLMHIGGGFQANFNTTATSSSEGSKTAALTIDPTDQTTGNDRDTGIAINNIGLFQWGVTYSASSSFVLAEVYYDSDGDNAGYVSINNNSVTYNTSSDYRLKENLVGITDGISRLKQLKPYRFNFIKTPDKTLDGFVAHEAQEVVPEAVSGEKDQVDSDGEPVIQGIDQSKLVPLLTAALQEAIAKIEVLETKVANLESKI